jgi:hypothetical protein
MPVPSLHKLSGGCHCGNLRLEMALSRAPDSYAPRVCDCDFCVKHAAAYISDPQGSLSLKVDDASRLARYRQGSGQAEFLLCTGCGVLAAVVYEEAGRRYGAANVRAFQGEPFGAAQAVSPKQLGPDEKTSRWQTVWFPEVSLSGA